ncbi:MAG: protein-L-isoaspartate(D-aspartate) O-methyltransferase [Candidatus Cyclonatronum sp.]|uniref:protein-L-isoaspartate(D-aspartate) O-methyltransferase n=1 Tax=Cyclonatronum sp. TaxID=3024185 RepID=UPI0025BF62AC|nr:protein-L-isoaspartate(D-aspartate) O-methyltransferase [Cyclonatronum sp.]MCC5935203.1 protein-L-isoaspartate(D-aspartate) O-methyltransferase [Balneolales bacterium]MCH8487119.1 protein-L-isoaspartate(D-aspartate) O-methyltransferase [Cyclonatronum sp.]
MTLLQEHPKYRLRRDKLVQTLLRKGIVVKPVLEAIGRIPRQLFIDSAFDARAYDDSPLPIGHGQTISQPYTVARQTELLCPQPGERILEVGTGSGYQAAVLLELGVKLYSIERLRPLHERARDTLRALGYTQMQLKCGDGTQGWRAYAPFDGIIVTAGAPVVPEDLISQLADGGRLIIPVGDDQGQQMLRIIRKGDEFIEEDHNTFKFVKLIGKKGWDAPGT